MNITFLTTRIKEIIKKKYGINVPLENGKIIKDESYDYISSLNDS